MSSDDELERLLSTRQDKSTTQQSTTNAITTLTFLQVCCCSIPATTAAAIFTILAFIMYRKNPISSHLLSKIIKFGSIVLASGVDLAALGSWGITFCFGILLCLQSSRTNELNTTYSLPSNPRQDLVDLKHKINEATDNHAKACIIILFFEQKLKELIKFTAIEKNESTMKILVKINNRDYWLKISLEANKFHGINDYLNTFNRTSILRVFKIICNEEYKQTAYQQLIDIIQSVDHFAKHARDLALPNAPTEKCRAWVNETFQDKTFDDNEIEWNESLLDQIAKQLVDDPLKNLYQQFDRNIEDCRINP